VQEGRTWTSSLLVRSRSCLGKQQGQRKEQQIQTWSSLLELKEASPRDGTSPRATTGGTASWTRSTSTSASMSSPTASSRRPPTTHAQEQESRQEKAALPERATMPSPLSRTSHAASPSRSSRAASRPIHAVAAANATPDAGAAAAFFRTVIVEDFFRPVRKVERPGMGRIFITPGPTEQAFMSQAVFLTGRFFSAGNAVFQARNGLNERGLGGRHAAPAHPWRSEPVRPRPGTALRPRVAWLMQSPRPSASVWALCFWTCCAVQREHRVPKNRRIHGCIPTTKVFMQPTLCMFQVCFVSTTHEAQLKIQTVADKMVLNDTKDLQKQT
jgi:hypothetical protein